MRQQRQPIVPPDLSGRFITELIEGVARAVALTVEVFLHRGFGSRYIASGFVGVLVVYLLSLWFPPESVGPLIVFAMVYGAFWLLAALNALIRHVRGTDTMHSGYNGVPHLWRLLPGWQETSVKYLEAVLAVMAGYGVHHLNRPLGDYLMVASSFVLLRVYGHAADQRSRAVALNDSVIEQRMVAERFRSMQE